MFSIAMTACAAKFVNNSICLSVNEPHLWVRYMLITPSEFIVLEHRH